MWRSFIALGGLALLALVSLGGAAAPDDEADDEELRTLMKERYEAAWVEMEARIPLYAAGRVALDDTCDAIRRFSTAGLAVARTPAYRVQVCERAFENARAVEDTVKLKFDSGVEPVQAMKLATYTRLDMEIKLHKARQAEAADKARSKLDDSGLRPFVPPIAKAKADT